jgi:hypothetical protein
MRRILIGLVLMLITLPAWADDWHAANNYPSRAVAFTFGSAVLDANHSVRFGSWTVSFDAQGFQDMFIPPGYEWYAAGGYYPATHMVCANARLGRTGCNMFLYPAGCCGSPQAGDRCALALNPIGDLQKVDIPCPTDITFQR